jgi:hypothetical protein
MISKWKNGLLIAALLSMLSSAQAAETVYACKVNNETTHHNTYLYAARFDFSKHRMTWNGKVFKNLNRVMDDDCAKECYAAASLKSDVAIRLETATQGVATLIVSGSLPVVSYDCDLLR